MPVATFGAADRREPAAQTSFSILWKPLGEGNRVHWRKRVTLLRAWFFRTLKAMEVDFTPEQEARLAEIATSAGTDPERLVKEAALRLLEEDARFRAAVREGISQADRGEFIEEDEMDARFEQMLRS
jgi:predicted transcriptional regulator